jgi:DNA-binding LacI/PurR family transcriptional regulator
MRITLKEVASRAGVSYQTVSKVINGQAQVSKETEERIWRVVKELGYRPNYTARSLRANRSFTIGYSWKPTPPSKPSPVLDQLLQSMLQAAAQNNYYLLSFPVETATCDQVCMYRELIYTGRVDGFILSAIEYEDPRIKFLLDNSFPFVAFGRSSPDMSFPYIDVDGGTGLRLATEHFLAQGHRKVAVLGWPESSRVGNNRIEGYFQAMQNAGLEHNSNWIARGEGTYEFGYHATEAWITHPSQERPTAIVALNDAMAIGAMQAIQANGLEVGRQIGVSGFDANPYVDYLTPSLTTVAQPVWEVGQRVIDILVKGLNDNKLPEPTGMLLMPTLIVRQSSLLEGELEKSYPKVERKIV